MGTDHPWLVVRGRGNNGRSQSQNTKGRGSSFSFYTLGSSNFPVLQRGNMSLINMKIQHITEPSSSKTQNISPSICLDDMPEDHPLYEQIKSYISAKKTDSYVVIASENTADRPNYENLEERELILLVENSQICKQEDSWRLLQKHLLTHLYFAGESFKTRAYYENVLVATGSVEIEHHQLIGATTEYVHGYSKMVIKKLLSIEDWATTPMAERYLTMKDSKVTFTYWDYIKAFT